MLELLKLYPLGILQQRKDNFIFFKTILAKVSNENVYIYRQFDISFNSILNKRFLVFKNKVNIAIN